MRLSQKIKNILKPFYRLPFTARVFIGVFVVLGLLYGLIFALPKSVEFAYAGTTCARQLTLFPEVTKLSQASGFTIRFKDPVFIAGYPVLATSTCFVAASTPQQGEAIVRTAPFGWALFAKQFKITIGSFPVAHTGTFDGKTLPVTRPIIVKLDQADKVFTYSATIDKKTVDCEPIGPTVACDITALELEQGKVYDVTISRSFNDESLGVVAKGSMTTLRAITLTSASVEAGKTVYDNPDAFTFEYDKALLDADVTLSKVVEGVKTLVPTKLTIDDKKLSIVPAKALDRNSTYEFAFASVEAEDGSALPDPYTLPFTMSGGPKVTGVSVGTSGSPLSGSIVLSMDQEVANVDKIDDFVNVSGLSARVVKNGASLVVSYADAALCQQFTISIKAGFTSQYGITQQDSWSFTGRTTCHTTGVIGYSTKGRAILSYTFGSGSRVILFTGALHGNERSATYLMNAWIDELEANTKSIPEGTRVVVVPTLNPDGYLAGTRTNANNVDLNRNFDTSDWKKDIQNVQGQPFPGGGGSYAGSEAETRALKAYTSALRPVLTMSYHSQAAYAIGNTCGNSSSLAGTYASMTGYRNMTGVGGAFAYEITGTYDDWICEKLGLASVLIELATSNNAEFSRNKSAMWAMVRS